MTSTATEHAEECAAARSGSSTRARRSGLSALGLRLALLLLLLGATLAAAVAGLTVGPQDISPTQVWQALNGDTHPHADVIRLVRLPRTLLGLTMGAALACAGALVQAVTRNPLADPGLLGVNSGAGFAVTLAAVTGLATHQIPQMIAATIGALAAAALVAAVGRTEPLRLVLTGMALSAVLLGVSLGCRLMEPDVFDVYRFWSVGTLAGQENTPLTVPLATLSLLALLLPLVVVPLDAVSLGDDLARTLGAQVTAARIGALALATVATAVAVATCGPISFLGLLAPHLVRKVAAGSVPWSVGLSLVAGACLLTASDVLSRVLLPTGEVPVAVVTAFLGGIGLATVMARNPGLRA